ncbi:MAG: hypothetical protein MJA29_07815, partial [Candidatus Omnitrophica bacterium]|nr:hypothetical protein [Candidatus Omnitrophota bacterium]
AKPTRSPSQKSATTRPIGKAKPSVAKKVTKGKRKQVKKVTKRKRKIQKQDYALLQKHGKGIRKRT